MLGDGVAVVCSGDCALHLAREQPESRVGVLGPRGAAQVPGHSRAEGHRPHDLRSHGPLRLHDLRAEGERRQWEGRVLWGLNVDGNDCNINDVLNLQNNPNASRTQGPKEDLKSLTNGNMEVRVGC